MRNEVIAYVVASTNGKQRTLVARTRIPVVLETYSGDVGTLRCSWMPS